MAPTEHKPLGPLPNPSSNHTKPGSGAANLPKDDWVKKSAADELDLTAPFKPLVPVRSDDLQFLNNNDDRSCGWAEGELVCPDMPGKKLVGVDGKWYDVANFISRHPGGPIIEEFIGKDATAVFHAYGHKGVLKSRKPVASYQMPERDDCDRDFERLRDFFEKKGFFETDYGWYLKKSMLPICLWLGAWFFVMNFNITYIQYLGAVCLAFFWQQSGFIMHEFHHCQVFRRMSKDNWGGVFFGTVCFGISSNWWRDEHIVHHAMTNTVDAPRKFADPQMWESLWSQHHRYFELFNTEKARDMFTYLKQRLQWCLIKVQHITFVPVVTMVGRFEIVTDSFRKERRWFEWAAWPFHWMWLLTMLSYLPDTRSRVIFYLTASWIQGIFHFQLILSHYCRKHLRVDEFHKASWYKFQILSNMNLEAPKWMDWYYGGLNYHIEHHLYPKMARKHLREAGYYVKQVCDKHGIEYAMDTFTGALITTLVHLKETGDHYTIDPR